jgi:hypothetical protein
MIRRILIDHARSRGFAKRGGDAQRLTIDQVLVSAQARGIEVLALDKALKTPESMPGKAVWWNCATFGGLSIEETAAAIGVSVDTAKRDWRNASAWLLVKLSSK